MRALMDAHVDAGSRLLNERLAAGMPERLDDTLRLLMRAAIDNHRDNPRLHRVLFDEAPRAPAFLARVREMERFNVDAAARLLDRHPDIRAGRLTAHVVVATIDSLVHRLVTAPDPAEFQDVEVEIVALLMAYLRQPGARSSPVE